MGRKKFSLKDLDIYGKKLCFFYKNRDKISSYFDVFLTILYLMIFFFLFIFLTVRSITRTDFKIYNSVKYSETIPSMSLNNDNFYLAFGIEDKNTYKRFIDESIYNVSVLYITKQKINNIWITLEKKELGAERCKLENFSEKHQKLFGKNELNSSYCIKELKNQSLTGSYTYDIISYFLIKISPCVNSTTNSNKCKSQNIIDKYISGAYASVDMQDIGVTPDNYYEPIVPLIHNVAANIDKKYLRELIITKKIVEVKTDNGLIFESTKVKKYIQSDKESNSLITRDEEEYYKGEPAFRLIIRLSDKIDLYERVCKKLSEVLATAGGYLQLFSNVFSVISFLFSRFYAENILINELFKFNLKEEKLILKKHKSGKKVILSDDIKKGLNEIIQNFATNLQKSNISENQLLLVNNPTDQVMNDKKISKTIDLCTIYKSQNNKHKNISFLNKRNNESSLIVLNKNNEGAPISSANKKYISKKSAPKLTYNINNEKSEICKGLNTGETIEKINYNWFEYYLGRCLSSKPKNYLNLYQNGKEMLEFQLDIVNIFTHILINKEFMKGIINSKLID